MSQGAQPCFVWPPNGGRLTVTGARVCTGEIMVAKRSTRAGTRGPQAAARDRLDVVGRLAGGLAHDFNNLLTTINGFAQLVLESLPPDDELVDDVTEIVTAGKRAAALTHQLLAFSGRQILQPRVLDLGVLVRGAAPRLRELVGESVEVHTRVDSTPGYVHVDLVQLEQALMNLAVNAREAMGGTGRLTLATSLVDLDRGSAQIYPGLPKGRYVRLTLRDVGAGIDEETRAHIFEPFFTTKPTGQGAGLRLSVVYGIVHQSGGGVAVESEPGHGTTFTIYLPQVSRVAESSALPEEVIDRSGGSETILLVDDEDSVRRLAGEFLRRRGYTVLEAAAGDAALGYCRGHRGPLHLLVTDVIMPGMNGRELAERTTAIRPELKVLYMSGYADQAIVHDGILDGGLALVSKPLTMETLTRKVRAVLDTPVAGTA